MFKVMSMLISRIVGYTSLFTARIVDIGSGVKAYGAPIISAVGSGKIKIGKRVVLVSSPKYTALGVSRPVILRLLREGAYISIGDDTGCSGVTICAEKSVTIGSECLLGADVIITDTDFHQISAFGRRYERSSNKIKSEPVEIGNNVFIGARSIVLKGVRVGDNSVIAAGSIVTKSIPNDVIAAGNPAVIVRSL